MVWCLNIQCFMQKYIYVYTCTYVHVYIYSMTQSRFGELRKQVGTGILCNVCLNTFNDIEMRRKNVGGAKTKDNGFPRRRFSPNLESIAHSKIGLTQSLFRSCFFTFLAMGCDVISDSYNVVVGSFYLCSSPESSASNDN